MKVFLDTNVLIGILDVYDPSLFPKDTFCTFEKNIYEFMRGVRRHLVNSSFIIDKLTSREIPQDSEEHMKRVARESILLAYDNIETSDIHALIKALKQYDLNFELGKAGEFIYEDDKEFESKGQKYCESFNIRDPLFQLHLFYNHIYRQLPMCESNVNKKLAEYGIEILNYLEVFSGNAISLNYQETLKYASVPSEDLEIILAALYNGCNMFLSCDSKLIKSCRSLGLNHSTCFIQCNPTTLIEDITNALTNYS